MALHLEKTMLNDDLKVDMADLEEALKKDEVPTDRKETIRKLKAKVVWIPEI